MKNTHSNTRFFVASLGIFLLAIVAPSTSFAQEDSHYSTEKSWGITKATNSGLLGGFVFRYSRLRKGRVFRTYGVELVNIKHPDEVRKQLQQTGNSILLGKTNYLYDLRLQYGIDMILFKKAQYKGVQINATFAGGPSFGIVTPYYVDYEGKKMPYSPETVPSAQGIRGPGNLLQGVPEASIVPGLNIKSSLSFEFGSKRDLFIVETGMMAEIFSKKIEIIAGAEKYAFYPNAFVTILYGSRR